MSHRQFPPELRTASVVPRWSIVWTLTRDTVSNHSFFVTFYTREIAKLIKWRGDTANLMYRALVHDLDETISGDIVSPVKAEIIDDKRAEAYISAQMTGRLPHVMLDLSAIKEARPDEWDEATRIIKAADKLDALIFLITEGRLGNGVIAPHMPYAWKKFKDAWAVLPYRPGHRDQIEYLWEHVMYPAVKAHETGGGFGI